MTRDAGLVVTTDAPVCEEPVWRAALRRELPESRFVPWESAGDADRVDAAIVWDPEPGRLGALNGLRAVVTRGAGMDHILSRPDLSPDVTVRRLVDTAISRRMAEFVVLCVLHHHRGWDDLAAHQRASSWRPEQPSIAAERRVVGVLGLGELGRAACAALQPFGFELRGWSRSRVPLPGVRSYAGPSELPAFADGLDVLVCLLPMNAQTVGIVDAALLRALAPGALLVNAGRGAHVVEPDLLAALENGLASAVLDVCDPEPLPRGHPFWTHPRIRLTQHTAAVPTPRETADAAVRTLVELLGEGRIHG